MNKKQTLCVKVTKKEIQNKGHLNLSFTHTKKEKRKKEKKTKKNKKKTKLCVCERVTAHTHIVFFLFARPEG